MAVYKRDMVDINLETGNIHRSFLKHSIGYKDAAADHFGIRVFRNGEPVSLTGVSVQGIFMPPQGDPIAITSGNIVSENEAEVVLPQACYNYDGQFTLSIKLVDATNAVTGTMRIVDGMVDNTHASGTVAPTGAVPTYQEILAVYAQLLEDVTDYESVVATQDGKIDDLKSAFVLDTNAITGSEPIFFQDGTYNTSTDGTAISYSASTTCKCARFAVTPGEKVIIHGGAISSTQRLYVFEDSQGKAFGRSLGNLNGTYNITVPINAVYMCVNNVLSVMASGYYAYKGEAIKETVSTMETDLYTEIYGGNFNIELLSGGLTSGYYSGSGNVTPSGSYSHIDVSVTAGEVLLIDGTMHSVDISLFHPLGVFFDSNNAKIETVDNQTEEPYFVRVPTGAVKLGLNCDYPATSYPSTVPDGMSCRTLTGDFKGANVKLNDLSDGIKKIKLLAGIIRNDGTGWRYIDDSGHVPLNMTTVELTEQGQIVVNYGFTAKRIFSLVAVPDETFAGKYTLGGSVDVGKATYNVYELPHMIGGAVRYIKSTDTWDVTFSTFTGVSFNSTTGVVTLTHDSVNGLLTKEKYNVQAQGRYMNAQIGKVTDTTIQFCFVDGNGNVITNPTDDLYAYVTRFVNARFVDANNIVNASGNFWIFGAMEV